MNRCKWCLSGDKMIKYHDEEWGLPLHNDRGQFEFLTLEVMQCGLNWNMMIKKRGIFAQCFDNFDYNIIARYTEKDIERILNTPEMIKSRRKIEAVINNAKCFLNVINDYGSFTNYIWSYTGGKSVVYTNHHENIPSKNELSDTISKDMKKKGFKYIGSVTLYSHLQACGIINEHEINCFRYKELTENYPCIFKEDTDN